MVHENDTPPWFRLFHQYCHLEHASNRQSNESGPQQVEYPRRGFREWLYRYPMFRPLQVALDFVQCDRQFLIKYYCARSLRLCPTAFLRHALYQAPN